MPIERFPWALAWGESAAKQARASQIGILTTLRGLLAFAGIPHKALAGCNVLGPRKEGKTQLHIDEAREFIRLAVEAGDSLSLAAVTMAVAGLRAGEVLGLRARDVDDGGAVLHVYGTKTQRARRAIPIDPAFRPLLLHAAKGRAPEDPLFPRAVERQRKARDSAKAARDALLRRVKGLCVVAGVPKVCSHSLRGLNATLRRLGGAADESITRALGHGSITTTERHYFAPGIVDSAEMNRSWGRLLPAEIGKRETLPAA